MTKNRRNIQGSRRNFVRKAWDLLNPSLQEERFTIPQLRKSLHRGGLIKRERQRMSFTRSAHVRHWLANGLPVDYRDLPPARKAWVVNTLLRVLAFGILRSQKGWELREPGELTPVMQRRITDLIREQEEKMVRDEIEMGGMQSQSRMNTLHRRITRRNNLISALDAASDSLRNHPW